jgi:hypothetical protein
MVEICRHQKMEAAAILLSAGVVLVLVEGSLAL